MADSQPSRLGRLGAALRRLTGFWANKSGNIAMMFGIAAIPFFAFGGLAVDFSRAMMVKNRLGAALDATALAVGGQTGMTEAQLTTSANAYFKANYPDTEIGRPTALRLTFSDRQVTVAADASVDTVVMGLIGVYQMTVSAEAEVKRSSNSLEIAMVLDVTGSMSGSRITDLKSAAVDLVNIVVWDDQSQFTSKVALVPFSIGVNVGTYAAAVRGAAPAGKTITGAAWTTGTSKTITGATKANPIVITSNAHGFATGDWVWISGVGGMTQLNTRAFTITKVDANKFSLNGVNGTSGYSTFTSGGTIRKCLVSDCGMVLTSNNHGFNNGDLVYITGITSGMTQLNNAANTRYTVANKTTNTFSLVGINGATFTNYTSGGSVFCTTAGCEWYGFTNAQGAARVQQISTCVTERIGTHKYDDVAPATALIGRNYPASANPCLSNTIVPLTSDKALLTTRINALAATGSTAGQIGAAWGWYMISPNFASLWPTASQPKAYDTDELIKIAIFMTDGDFNTNYCNGVIAADAGTGSGSAADHINCNATNGDALVQAAAQCEAMKSAGITVYTVGFDIADVPALVTQLRNCATDSAHAYLADNGPALRAAFRAIAVDISNLRLSH